MKKLLLIMTLALAQTFAQTVPTNYEVGVKWNKNPEPYVSHYMMTYYTQKVNNNIVDPITVRVDNPVEAVQPRVQVPNLQYGKTYTFFVVAVSDEGLQSEPSDEVIYVRFPTPGKPTGLTIDIP
jgi:hypothetical protein